MITARDIMHAGAQCIDADESVRAAAMMMRSKGVGALPICGPDQKLKGMITDRDIVMDCLAAGKDPDRMKAIELSGHVHCVRADDDLDVVLLKMEQHQVRRMPVIDNERLVGIITEKDLAMGHKMAKGVTDQQIIDFMDSMFVKH
ncbi:CBS domain-containing protein [Streptacidiphilus jiangxiensis]|uniref:CBS domain-containing protein n=1 Tax=Streptacidiphilus jiangxiensis TaxID=235985 RepID=A0A1H7WF38_STRJI|nr:CBS domain-containing protein [Streptacidiphilus jiangxiensis]SEM19699.1 CBS domain-containing protein [Streptacidiphilus jiangxiensis]